MTAALATVDDVETRIGRTVIGAEADRLAALLTDASARVRGYTGQEIAEDTSTVRLKVKGGRVRLPQWPVTEVSAVTNTAGTAIAYIWDAGADVWLTAWIASANGPTYYGPGLQYVDVTYTHGYDPVPDVIVAVVCQMVGRALGTTPGEGAVQSESIGAYNYQLGSAAAAGGLGLLPAEKEVLDAFRRPAGPITMTASYPPLRR